MTQVMTKRMKIRMAFPIEVNSAEFGKVLKSFLIITKVANEEDSPWKWIETDLEMLVVKVTINKEYFKLAMDLFERFNGKKLDFERFEE